MELATWIALFCCSIYYATVQGHQHKDDQTCGASHGHRIRRHNQELFPRRPPSGTKYGYAIEFETGQVIQYLSKQRSPSKKFSVDFWMKPEGGQHNPSIVLHAYDKCAPENEARGWFIGLREASVTSDLRITFTVHSASAQSNKTIMSHKKLEAGRWVHVAATYDGIRMKLYVNQAKVAVGYGQKGMIFDSSTQGHACDLLEIGGDIKRGLYYRGQIDKLRLWNDAISHRALTQSLPENTIDNLMDKLFMYDDFDENNVHKAIWIPATDKYPRFVLSTVPEDKHDLSIRKPPCGKTICDNPEVVRSYLKHKRLRGSKHLQIRFINVKNDDGSNPMLTDAEINSQFKVMQHAFSQYNISWELKVESVKNSWLRQKKVLNGCEVAEICHDKCLLELTGWDGGDCKGKCPSEKRGDGKCDPECNNERYSWDKGDCCMGQTSTTCADPNSPNRVYLSVGDFKQAVGLNNRGALNVYVVNWSDEHLQLGTATFPWEKTVHTELGGVVLPHKNFGTTKVLVHEIGHILGLWHVHHGSGSEMDCSADCIESFPSLELGDLCSDTQPTVLNNHCGDPNITENSCGLPQYKDTPYDNFMSYASDSCVNNFSPQQVARMHCYIDLNYQSWQKNAKPSFVPLSPRIISANKDRVQLSWLPPFGPGGNNAKNLCNECDEGYMLEQYATTAYSPNPSSPKRKYAAHQAVGPPDAEHCDLTPLSWRATQDYLGCPDCPLYLEVGFKQAVVPTELTIWVSYKAKDAFSDILLIYVDGSTKSIGGGTAQCDSPFMKQLHDIKKKVSKVRIFVSQPAVCIDAVKLTSGIGHPNCSKCRPLHYVIKRDPPFDTAYQVSTARFEDKNIDAKGRYEYRVRAVTHDGLAGPFSPPLIYEPKRGFCGDGKIDEGEKCDDGNVRDGDGCNIQCEMEDVFHCDGRPSLCYRHDGDGVCEEFEKQTNIKDCGFYTPEGFRDQWAHRATPNPKYTYTCAPDGIIGPPRPDLKCASDWELCTNCGDGWCPAHDEYEPLDVWIKIYFKTPAIASALIIYLANVMDDLNIHPPLIKFELHGSGANEKTTLEHRLSKICKENPLVLPIHHDMTKPFFKTQYVKMMFDTRVKIAAVSLRSKKYFDPVGLERCTGSQLFHPSTQKCQNYDCDLPKCSKLMLKYSTQKVKCKKGSVEGDKCMVQCDKGFTPAAPFEVMCSGGEWTVDGEVPRCTPLDCGFPNIENADIICPVTTVGMKCRYKCKDGTKQAGSGTDLSVTCEADGLWSATSAFCHRTCPPPPTPPLSRLLLTSKNCNKGKPFIPGETCKYRCKTGYIPSGHYQRDLFRKGHFLQRCLKGGSWTGKRCVPVRCPVHDPKIYRWYNCTQGNKFGTVCRLACPGEKVREVKCGADGKWDKKFQFCLTKGSCPAVDLDTVSCDKHRKPGDECKVICTKGWMPVVKDDSSKKRIKSLTCSPSLQWYPDPSDIKCSMTCYKEGLEDGYCDPTNNNEDCDWDGGDCCDPDAIKSEETCGENLSDCKCLDVTSPHHGMSSGDDSYSS